MIAPNRFSSLLGSASSPRASYRRIPAWLVDAILFVPIVAAGVIPIRDGGVASPLTATLLFTPAVLLPFRRRFPLWMLAANVIVFAVAASTHSVSPAFAIPLGIAVYSVAVTLDRRTGLLAAACAAMIVVGFSCVAYPVAMLDPRIIQLLSFIAIGGAAGDAAKSRRAYIFAIAERAVRAERSRDLEARRRVAEERLRIARDLHDAVAHQIAVINLHAAVASSALTDRPADAESSLVTIRTAARSVLQEISDLLGVLRSGSTATDAGASDGAGHGAGHGSDEGLVAHPLPGQRAGLGRLAELLASYTESGLQVTVRQTGDEVELPALIDIVAYRVIQEALTNAHKHGKNNTAKLVIGYGANSVDIEVSNPTRRGRAAEASTEGSGNGLWGMRERVTSVRGTVTVHDSEPGRFTLEVHLPRSNAAGASRSGSAR